MDKTGKTSALGQTFWWKKIDNKPKKTNKKFTLDKVRCYTVINTEGVNKEKGGMRCLDGSEVDILPWGAKEGLTVNMVVK